MEEKNQILNNVLSNAFDFLNKSAYEFESHTKYSIIHFFSAIELFLKARLIAEHWSLIVVKKPNFNNFINGSSQTLQFDDLVYCLKHAFEKPQIGEEDIKAFDEIRKERNKIIHFYHDLDNLEPAKTSVIKTNLAIKQLKAWYCLKYLLSYWSLHFDHNQVMNSLIRFDANIVKLKNYYDIRFEAIKDNIEQSKKMNNKKYIECDNCHKEAMWACVDKNGFGYYTCLVCDNFKKIEKQEHQEMQG